MQITTTEILHPKECLSVGYPNRVRQKQSQKVVNKECAQTNTFQKDKRQNNRNTKVRYVVLTATFIKKPY